jgi:hypothetical protein
LRRLLGPQFGLVKLRRHFDKTHAFLQKAALRLTTLLAMTHDTYIGYAPGPAVPNDSGSCRRPTVRFQTF